MRLRQMEEDGQMLQYSTLRVAAGDWSFGETVKGDLMELRVRVYHLVVVADQIPVCDEMLNPIVLVDAQALALKDQPMGRLLTSLRPNKIDRIAISPFLSLYQPLPDLLLHDMSTNTK
jgi:hypothetical protein